MIASLPMYDRPEWAAAYDALWSGIKSAYGGALPDALDRGGDPWAHWHSPDLAFSQTCGLPYRMGLYKAVDLIGTPDYGLPGCPPGYYRSVIVARGPAEQPIPGPVLAVNDGRSQSGWAAAVAHGAPFDRVLETGGHAASAAAVAFGDADYAFIDAVSWRGISADHPELEVIGETTPTPGLPYITRRGGDAVGLARAVEAAIAALDPAHRATTGLVGLAHIPQSAYLAQPLPPPLPN
ncbi:MAG: PhnD/SsuA/transferrin family substrate-binding protein [Pseudomonadota bacterium]